MVEIAASSAMCKTRAQVYDATIAAVERRSPTTLAFTLEGAGPVAFLPGQYVNLRLPGSAEHRSYSFASAPGDDRLAFLIRDIPDGRMSGFLRAAAPGTAVEFTGPSGSFYLRDVTRPLLFLAGGTGLAPVPVDAAPAGGEGDERPARSTSSTASPATTTSSTSRRWSRSPPASRASASPPWSPTRPAPIRARAT